MLWQMIMAKRLAIKKLWQLCLSVSLSLCLSLSLSLSLFLLLSQFLAFSFLFLFLIILLQFFHGAKSTVPKKSCPKRELNPCHSRDWWALKPLSHEDQLRSASSKVANISIPVQGVEAATPQTFARALTGVLWTLWSNNSFFNDYMLEKACWSM